MPHFASFCSHTFTAASKRPKLEPLSSTGTPLDMSSSTVLVDSPVLPEDNKAGPSGAREKWWTQPGPADKCVGWMGVCLDGIWFVDGLKRWSEGACAVKGVLKGEWVAS